MSDDQAHAIDAGHPEQRRPALTLSEAAKRTGAHRSTIRRRLDGGDFPHAWRDVGRSGPGTGPWMVPVSDLLAAGLHLDAPPPDDDQAQPQPERGEVEQLRDQLADWRRRAEVAEALAREREARIADLRQALAALSAGDTPPSDEALRGAERPADGPGAPTPAPTLERAPSRSWWRRLRGQSD